MSQTYHNEISESIHGIASALHKAGAIDNAQMQHYDRVCLKPIEPLNADEIRAIRENWHIESMIAAVIADDPESATISDSLKTSLQQAQQGNYATAYTPSTIAQRS